MKTTRRPGRSLAALALASAAVLAAAAVFRLAGRGALNACLAEPQGDPTALQGFTVQGTVTHSANALTTFSVQDGAFASATVLDPDAEARRADDLGATVSWGQYWSVPQQDLAAVNAAATAEGAELRSRAERLELVYALYLPDGSRVSFQVLSYAGTEPIPVYSYWDGSRGWQDWGAVDEDALPERPAVHYEVTRWQGSYYFAWMESAGQMPAGVYRVDEALTAEETAALRDNLEDGADGPNGRASASYGAISLLYAPQNAARVLGCRPAGSLMAVLYLDTENALRLDLVDGDGRLQESLLLAEQVDTETDCEVEPLPCQRAGEAAFLCPDGPQGHYAQRLVIVRVENGRVTKLYNEPYAAPSTNLAGESWGGELCLAQLDDTGTRLLLVEEVYDVWKWTVRGYEERTLAGSFRLTVQDAAGGKPHYTARLKTDQLSGWGWGQRRYTLYGPAGALTQVNASAYVDFPDIAE